MWILFGMLQNKFPDKIIVCIFADLPIFKVLVMPSSLDIKYLKCYFTKVQLLPTAVRLSCCSSGGDKNSCVWLSDSVVHPTLTHTLPAAFLEISVSGRGVGYGKSVWHKSDCYHILRPGGLDGWATTPLSALPLQICTDFEALPLQVLGPLLESEAQQHRGVAFIVSFMARRVWRSFSSVKSGYWQQNSCGGELPEYIHTWQGTMRQWLLSKPDSWDSPEALAEELLRSRRRLRYVCMSLHPSSQPLLYFRVTLIQPYQPNAHLTITTATHGQELPTAGVCYSNQHFRNECTIKA